MENKNGSGEQLSISGLEGTVLAICTSSEWLPGYVAMGSPCGLTEPRHDPRLFPLGYVLSSV